MYIKLSYTASKNIMQIFRVLTDIINTPSVTDVASFWNRANSAPYGAGLMTSFDSGTSTIIRTSDPSGVKAHFSGQNSTTQSKFTLEYGTYDDAATKYYIQYNNTATTYTSYYVSYGSTITGGTISSSQCPITIDTANTAYLGTALTPGGYSTSYTTTNNYAIGGSNQSTNSSTGVRTFWAYVSNTAFIWATNASSAVGGWSSTPSQVSGGTSGPWIASQYTRYDYFNTNANGIIPLIFCQSRADGLGLMANDFNYPVNDYYGSLTDMGTVTSSLALPAQVGTVPPFAVLNIPRIGFQLNSSRTYAKPAIVTGQQITPMLGTRTTAQPWGFANNGSGTSNAITLLTGNSFYVNAKRVIDMTTIGSRVATQDLSTGAFQHLPLAWHWPAGGCFGGNASERGGFYIFNGDYTPGDEYTTGGITYSIWPMFDGNFRRLGLSIPKV